MNKKNQIFIDELSKLVKLIQAESNDLTDKKQKVINRRVTTLLRTIMLLM